jgi:cytolysin (calcineurin-like family phosphatase)
MVMASDSQYPRTLNGAYNDKEEARRLIRNHVSSMNELINQFPVKGVVMNGDITEYGHPWELERIKTEYGKLRAPFYPGLGNHDYENNVNDCLANHCAERMIRYIRKFIKDEGLVDRANFDFDFKKDEGSLAYFWDIGNVRFFQLHNYPTYETEVNEFNITASTSWLERECKKAREQNKHIIFNMHIEGFSKDKNKIIQIINDYKVSAVFVGHTHYQIGNVGWMGSASVLNCGASFTEQYMLVEFVGDKMKYWNVSSVDGKATRSNEGEITLR